MPWDEGLEEPALSFASCETSPVRALAGPGTGKTFALLRRVARVIEQGASPDEVLVVTFARTAARDLVTALQGFEGGLAADVRAGTLHGLCFRILSSEGVLHATGRVPRVLLEFERNILLLDLEGTFAVGFRERDKLRRAFEAAWARMQSDEPGEPVEGLDQEFQDALLRSLRWHRGMLIGEVVPIALSYLRNNPHAEERTAYKHVFVDEYQDLNRAEQAVVDLLCDEATLTVIGDDDQSIYGFKSANPEGIRTFADAHPGTFDVQITECRRCPEAVVEMAQALIQRNPGRVRAALHARPGNPPGEIHHVQWRSIADEAAGIASFVESRVRAGVEPGRCLILAPSRRIGYAIRDAVRAAGVEIHSFFREEAISSERAQQALTLLTLLARPHDRIALRAWLSFGITTQRRGPYRRAWAAARGDDVDVAQVLAELEAGTRELRYGGSLLEPWRDLLVRLEALRPLEEDFVALCDALFPPGEDGEDDDDLAALRSAALEAAAEADSLAGFVDGVRYRIAQPEVPLETPYARVMSLHKSKGLTADLVVIAGLVEGSLPRLDNVHDEEALQEQRRLFFVGITRTTDVLVLSSYASLEYATAMQLGAQIGTRIPGQRGMVRVVASRFLAELGPSLPAAVRGEDWDP